MLSIIKTYQSETASQHSPSQNSPSCCTPGCLFTKRSLLFTFTQNALALLTGWFEGPSKPTKLIKEKSVSVGFECLLRGEKKLLLEQENLDSVLKSIST